MKLSKVIFPEIVKGARFQHESCEYISEYIRNSIKFVDVGKIEYNTNSSLKYALGSIGSDLIHVLFKIMSTDPNIRVTYSIAHEHFIKKAKNYHICKNFLDAMGSLKERDLNVDFLPKEFLGYFSLPEGSFFDGRDTSSGCYVSINKGDYVADTQGETLFLAIGLHGSLETDKYHVASIVIPLTSGKKISEILEQYNITQGDVALPNGKEIANTIINVLLYLNSQDPELLNLTPTFGGSHSHIKKHTQIIGGQECVNACTVPVIAVNWSYEHRQKHLSPSTTHVEAYLAWRRCGPNFSQIRLSYISEHERTYLKSQDDTDHK